MLSHLHFLLRYLPQLYLVKYSFYRRNSYVLSVFKGKLLICITCTTGLQQYDYIFGWINSSSPESTVKGFAIGTLVGSIIGHLIIQVIGATRSGLKYSFVPPRLRYLKEYLFISLPLVVGQSIAVIDEQLFQNFWVNAYCW